MNRANSVRNRNRLPVSVHSICACPEADARQRVLTAGAAVRRRRGIPRKPLTRRRTAGDSTPPPGSMPPPLPRRSSACAVVCYRQRTRRRWRRGHTAVASPSMHRCASLPLTAPNGTGCCTIASGRRSRWNGYAKSIPGPAATPGQSSLRSVQISHELLRRSRRRDGGVGLLNGARGPLRAPGLARSASG